MRLLEINSVCGIKSTGRIAVDIAKEYEEKGYEVKIAYGRDSVPEDCKKYSVKIGNNWDFYIHGIKSRLFDMHGLGSKRATKSFLEWASEYNPDILWIHNIHGYYINYEMLFDWIKNRPEMEVRWTLHDCWAFTGHCSHFSASNCYKWQRGCYKCIQKSVYPSSILIDNSKKNYGRKKIAFSNVEKLTICVPSQWLYKHVSKSFLGQYPIEVIPNRVDLAVFSHKESNFRQKIGVAEQKIMLLGLASVWPPSKGLADLLYIYKNIDKSLFEMVVVGLSQKQIANLPDGIIGMGCVERTELPEIYSAADLFINPSKEETFSLTTLEALSCKTATVVYKGTACEEIVEEYKDGYSVKSLEEMLGFVKAFCRR